MSIVAKLKAKWSRSEGAKNSGCSPEAHEIYALAEELEAHCEAMCAYPNGHSRDCRCSACGYRKWKLERGQT